MRKISKKNGRVTQWSIAPSQINEAKTKGQISTSLLLNGEFNSFHKHFGNWENLLAKVPEGSRSSLKNWGEAIKEGFLEDCSPSSRQSDLVIKRFVGGEDYMAPFERLKELVNPKERR